MNEFESYPQNKMFSAFLKDNHKNKDRKQFVRQDQNNWRLIGVVAASWLGAAQFHTQSTVT